MIGTTLWNEVPGVFTAHGGIPKSVDIEGYHDSLPVSPIRRKLWLFDSIVVAVTVRSMPARLFLRRQPTRFARNHASSRPMSSLGYLATMMI